MKSSHLGLTLAAAGIHDFSRAGTPGPTTEPTRRLVTTGAHGWSRNPIYAGMFLVYAAIGFAARSPWPLLLVVPLWIALRFGVVAPPPGRRNRQTAFHVDEWANQRWARSVCERGR